MKTYILIFLFFMLLLPTFTFAQESEADDVDDISLEDLLNVEVESASKKSESLFDAPLSVSVITQKEINNSGVTSIVDALRLIPGLIVREKTNGNYDVHIRGNDNLVGGLVSSINSKTLVLIDGRIVYSYFQGGTFWETLPIGLYDIDKIELIRGPAAALYGPNAVTGVINISTVKAEKNNKISTNADFQIGSVNTKIANIGIGYGTEKFGFRLSANYNYKERFQEEYYISEFDIYAARDLMWTYIVMGPRGPQQIISEEETKKRYPDVNSAVDSYGVNFFHFII